MAPGVEEGEPSRKRRTLPRTIAVDGSAASGKSAVGRRLAAKLGYPFLDTGSMYRAITWAALRRGIALGDQQALGDLASALNMEVSLADPGSMDGASISVDGEDVTSQLRQAEVEEAVSIVSRVAGVREAMVRLQREIAAGQTPVLSRAEGIVMAGRDIGTVVLPDADLKVYLDASIEERAGRRHREFATLGRSATQQMVLEDLRRRDQIDSQRAVSPLRPAEDAVIIDTDGLSLQEVVQRVLALVEARA